jgi:2-isopropylmalate synthase
MSEKIIIFDTTLRDGEQSPGTSMNTAEKLQLAIQMEKMGVDVIEAGFPAVSEGDLEAVTEIAQKTKKVQVAALSRTNKNDIDLAWNAVKHTANHRIHIFIATSDLHMSEKLRMSREQVMQEIINSINYAKKFTKNIEFSAEDGTRSDRDFMCKAYDAAIEAGATTINLPDTTGYSTPKEFAELVQYVRSHTPNIHKAVLSVHCHNDLGLATANTLAGIDAGARQAEVTINGIGERAGNTAMEEIVMALHTRPQVYPFTTNIKTEHISSISRLVSMTTGIIVQPNKAIVGANAFAHEAGIHQHGVLVNPMTYEIMKPQTIGLSTNKLVLGKHSGRHALQQHLREMGYDLDPGSLADIFEKFKALSDKKKNIMDEDLEALIQEDVRQITETFSLEYLNVNCGTTVMPMASIKLSIQGRHVQGADYGNGPIDAVFKTIAKLTDSNANLLRFTISALTDGTDALGKVTVRLEEDGLVVLGKGTDADIVTASAKSYLNGLNRLEFLKN